MEIPQQTVINSVTYCEWCLQPGRSRCGRCHSVFYCCREHQISHWSIHKKECTKIPVDTTPVVALNPQVSNTESMNIFPPQGSWCQNTLPLNRSENLNLPVGASNVYNAPSTFGVQEKPMDFQINEDEIFSSLNSEFLSSDNNFWDIINSCDIQNLFASSEDSEKEKAIAKISETLKETASAFSSQNEEPTEDTTSLMQCASVHEICRTIVRDLNNFGICVLDNFIGGKLGTAILDEVKNLYYKGIFKKGELVAPNPYMTNESIRSDVTTWVNGTEPECVNIGQLIKKLDLVVTTCNKLNNNGILSHYKLHRRTKAMIACYPGNRTYYKKHIDNPHRDGRCITCIYYLNKNWNVKEHGGLLRMFPVANSTQVANIVPIFDRMIFFWSDKRNPHEVLPAYQTRFAITVWYFDADERDRALGMYRNKQSQQHKT